MTVEQLISLLSKGNIALNMNLEDTDVSEIEDIYLLDIYLWALILYWSEKYWKSIFKDSLGSGKNTIKTIFF